MFYAWITGTSSHLAPTSHSTMSDKMTRRHCSASAVPSTDPPLLGLLMPTTPRHACACRGTSGGCADHSTVLTVPPPPPGLTLGIVTIPSCKRKHSVSGNSCLITRPGWMQRTPPSLQIPPLLSQGLSGQFGRWPPGFGVIAICFWGHICSTQELKRWCDLVPQCCHF